MRTRGTVGPFTKNELLDALAVVMPSEVVNEYRADLIDFPDEPGTITITDGMLLILAAISEGNADRVVSTRPDLNDAVARVRADPAAYLEEVRAAAKAEGVDTPHPPG